MDNLEEHTYHWWDFDPDTELEEMKQACINEFGEKEWQEKLRYDAEFEKLKQGWIYFLQWAFYIKIGMTMRTPAERVAEIELMLPYEAKLCGGFPSYRTRKIEQYLHKIFNARRSNGEWFILTESEYQEIRRFGEAEARYLPISNDYPDPLLTFEWSFS